MLQCTNATSLCHLSSPSSSSTHEHRMQVHMPWLAMHHQRYRRLSYELVDAELPQHTLVVLAVRHCTTPCAARQAKAPLPCLHHTQHTAATCHARATVPPRAPRVRNARRAARPLPEPSCRLHRRHESRRRSATPRRVQAPLMAADVAGRPPPRSTAYK